MSASTPATDRLTPAIYQAIASRYVAHDTMLWQAPALSLTAEAFLFTIALSAGNSQAARLLASSLALLVSVLSVQLMLKHRHHTLIDARLLEKLEFGEELTLILGTAPHVSRRALESATGTRGNLLTRWPSHKIWAGGLALFGLAALAVIVMTAAAPSMLN